MKTPLEQFQDLLDFQDRSNTEFHTDRNALQEAFDVALKAEFKRLFPRKRKFVKALLPEDIYKPILAELQPLANILVARHTLENLQIEYALNEMAGCIDLVSSDTSVEAYAVDSSRYSTQGWSSNKYAREDAEMYAETLRGQGLRAEIEVTRGEPYQTYGGGTNCVVYYKVMAWCSETMIEVAKRKPTQSLRDWLKSCWKRGCNPRVMNPYLPEGLEEKLGIDYFGNDVPRKEPVPST